MHAWKKVIYMKGNIIFKGDIGITIDPNKENFNYLVIYTEPKHTFSKLNHMHGEPSSPRTALVEELLAHSYRTVEGFATS